MEALSNNNSSSDEKNIAEVRKITGISDFQNLTSKEVEKISTLRKDGKLTDNQLTSVIKAFPESFIGALKELIGTLRGVVQSAGDVQKEGMQALTSSLDTQEKVLLDLAQRMETDQARIELARITIELATLKIEVSKIVNQATQANNSFWGKYLWGLVH